MCAFYVWCNCSNKKENGKMLKTAIASPGLQISIQAVFKPMNKREEIMKVSVRFKPAEDCVCAGISVL